MGLTFCASKKKCEDINLNILRFICNKYHLISSPWYQFKQKTTLKKNDHLVLTSKEIRKMLKFPTILDTVLLHCFPSFIIQFILVIYKGYSFILLYVFLSDACKNGFNIYFSDLLKPVGKFDRSVFKSCDVSR